MWVAWKRRLRQRRILGVFLQTYDTDYVVSYIWSMDQIPMEIHKRKFRSKALHVNGKNGKWTERQNICSWFEFEVKVVVNVDVNKKKFKWVSLHRVVGTKGLRVIDNSIQPKVVTTNTNLPAIVIGEKGADLVLNTWAWLIVSKAFVFQFYDFNSHRILDGIKIKMVASRARNKKLFFWDSRL